MFFVLSSFQLFLLLYLPNKPTNKQNQVSQYFFFSYGNIKDGRVHSLCHYGMRNSPCIYICMSMNCIFLLVSIVKAICTMLFQDIAIITVIYVNPLWSYKDKQSSVNEIDMWEVAYKIKWLFFNVILFKKPLWLSFWF